MSLSRAFTSRRPKNYDDVTAMPNRAFSQRKIITSGNIRSKISAPVELLSSTNMLSYNAPDIHSINSPLSASDEDSEASSQTFSSRASNTSSTDSLSDPPAPNHLTAFFANPDSPRTSGSSPVKATIAPPPAIPQRANTHTTATHKMLARKRSLSREPKPPPTAIHNIPVDTRTSATMYNATLNPAHHPFSRELQQVNELAEEMGLQSSVEDEEEALLRRKGFQKLDAQDYLLEIEELLGGMLGGHSTSLDASWI